MLVQPRMRSDRSIDRGFFQIQFRVSPYKHVGRPTHHSQKRDEVLEKVTNVFMEQYTLPTDTNEIPNLPTRDDVKTWWLSNEEVKKTSRYPKTGQTGRIHTQNCKSHWVRKVSV